MDQQTVLNILYNVLYFLLEEDTGIVIDVENNRYIVGTKEDELFINQINMVECDDEIKNLDEGTILPILGESVKCHPIQ